MGLSALRFAVGAAVVTVEVPAELFSVSGAGRIPDGLSLLALCHLGPCWEQGVCALRERRAGCYLAFGVTFAALLALLLRVAPAAPAFGLVARARIVRRGWRREGRMHADDAPERCAQGSAHGT